MNDGRPDRPLPIALVASADEVVIGRLTGALRRWRFATVVVADVPAATTALNGAAAADLVMIDARLGRTVDLDLCDVVRANPATENVPIVQFGEPATATADRTDGLLRGADAHLELPIDDGELFATLTALLRRSDGRRRAHRTAARLRSLNSATADVHAASDRWRVIHAVVSGASAVAREASVVITRDGGSAGAAARWHEHDGRVVPTAVPLAAFDLAVEPARAGQSTIEITDPRLVERPHVGVPFIDETGEPAGVIAVPVGVDDLRDEVLPLLAQLALTTSLATANIRALDIEHRIAVTLQRSLLPQRPPEVPGLEVAFRYVAAGHQTQVGGDFYEAFALDDAHVVVAIGDVVGHSLAAATVMAEVRHAVRAYALDGSSPAEVLERVERLIRRFHRTMYTTAVLGVVDLDTGRFDFCSSGHLPIVRCTSTRTELIESSGSLLGAGRPTPPLEQLPLHPGDRVFMVTDGLVERRGESLDDGLQRLRRHVDQVRHLAIDDALDALLAELGPGPAQDDDIAILAFEVSPDAFVTSPGPHGTGALEVEPVGVPQRRALPTPGHPVTPLVVQHVDLPRDRSAPACARRAVGLALAGESTELVDDALLAVSEVVTNAVLHAGGADRMTVCVDRAVGVLRFEVHDSTVVEPNRRMADLGAPGGRGLPILDRVCRRHGARVLDDGKVVWVEIDLSNRDADADLSGEGARSSR